MRYLQLERYQEARNNQTVWRRRCMVARLSRRVSEFGEYIQSMSDHVLTDGVVVLTPLAPDDAPEWLAGEDEEQLRWFEAPRPALLSDFEEFISSCQESWRTNHRGLRPSSCADDYGSTARNGRP